MPLSAYRLLGVNITPKTQGKTIGAAKVIMGAKVEIEYYPRTGW